MAILIISPIVSVVLLIISTGHSNRRVRVVLALVFTAITITCVWLLKDAERDIRDYYARRNIGDILYQHKELLAQERHVELGKTLDSFFGSYERSAPNWTELSQLRSDLSSLAHPVFLQMKNEAMGFSLEIPSSWTAREDSTPHQFQLNFDILGDEDTTVFLQSRYIWEIPEGVTAHRDWLELQYKEAEIDVQYIRPREVESGSCMEVRFGNEFETCHTLNFVDVFENPDHRRMWVLVVSSYNAEFFESDAFGRLLETLKVSRFNWEDAPADQAESDDSEQPGA